MAFLDQLKSVVRIVLVRGALLAAGCALVAGGIGMSFGAGNEIVSGLLSPDDAMAIVVSVARLLVPAAGLWLIYRALASGRSVRGPRVPRPPGRGRRP
jgi:hypothetical protein